MSSKSMFFLGSTGYIGGSVLTSILLSPTPPSSVVCLVRSPEKAKLLETLDLNGGKTKISCLVGSMEEHDKITKAAAEADVVVNTANADDLGCVKALVEGFKERKRKTTHRTIYIHTSGTGVMVDDARGNRPSDLIYTDLRPAPASRSSPALHSLDDIPSSAPHREVDIFITQSDARSECKAYIVLPSTIWGWGKGEIYDKGVSNPHSDQMPTMARIALDRGRAGVVGKGANIWPHVHISDTASLFSLIYTRALSASSSSSAPASSHIGHGTSGFYLAIAGEYTLLTAARAIGVALIDAGLSSSSDASPTALSEEEMKKYYGGSYYMGGNSRGRADRSKSIGWKPDWTDERDFIKSVKEEVGRMEGMYGKEMKEATAKVY